MLYCFLKTFSGSTQSSRKNVDILTLSRLWEGLCTVYKIEISARASSSEVYPSGKLQCHFTFVVSIAICGRFFSPGEVDHLCFVSVFSSSCGDYGSFSPWR